MFKNISVLNTYGQKYKTHFKSENSKNDKGGNILNTHNDSFTSDIKHL